MNITSAVFQRGLKGSNDILDQGLPQVAFIGRSNAGKSTLLNSLTNNAKLAVASKTPGRTQEINVFLINGTHHFLDLPGYGFTTTRVETWEKLGKLIYWYLFDSGYHPTIVLLIDAEIGPTKDDLHMLKELEQAGKEIIVVANKVDKIKKSQYQNQLKKLQTQLAPHPIFPYSSKTKIGIDALRTALLH